MLVSKLEHVRSYFCSLIVSAIRDQSIIPQVGAELMGPQCSSPVSAATVRALSWVEKTDHTWNL